MELLILLIDLLLISEGIIAYQYVFYKNRPFPIDQTSRQIIFGNNTGGASNGSGTDNETQNQCIQSSIGDYACDSINNRKECSYDGGDCCQGTCKAKCIENNISDCKCGSNSYDCKSENAPCVNCINGICETNMTKCYGDDEMVKLGVMACSMNSLTQGNTNTSDSFCGKDPTRSIVHYLNSPNYHYPGCGFKQINCTENPCCEVVRLNKDTYDNCNDENQSRYIWDASKKTYVLRFISCLSYYRKCFKENAAGISHGQCCQCKEGWGGTHCDVPLCKNCFHGTCVDENVCVCEPEYQGDGCNEAICDKCIHGICIDPNICECFYGYEGATCEKKVTFPMCVHGVPTGQDECTCDSGYKGRLCEIRICPSGCDFCDDELNCFANLEKQCDVISPKCIECSNRKCTKCKDNYALMNDNCFPLEHKWPNCNKGSADSCTECNAPYHLDSITGLCINNGMLEIGSRFQSALETDGQIAISINRYYGSDGQCNVFYEVLPIFNVDQVDYISNPLNKMSLSSGMLTFSPGEDEKEILLALYPDSLPVNSNSNNVFQVTIYNTIGGCIIGDVYQSQIEIFDNKVIDLSLLSIAVKSTSIHTMNSIYQIFSTASSFDIEAHLPGSNIGITLMVALSIDNTKQVYSSLMLFDGSDKYALSIPYNQLKSPIGFIGEKSLSVLYCESGSYYKMRYFDYAGANRNDAPYFIRNIKQLAIDDYYKQRSYFSIEWLFYIDNPNKKLYIEVTLLLKDLFTLRINDIVIKGEEAFNASNPDNTTKYTYAIDAIAISSKHIQFSFCYVHLKDKSNIDIKYSYDKSNYKSFDDLRRYSCDIIEEYMLMIY